MTDGSGNVTLLRTLSGWRSTWTHIVPGNFLGSSYGTDDLLFYDGSAGEGELYTTDGSGRITFRREHSGWRTGWDQIVPGNFGGSVHTDLFFYRDAGPNAIRAFYATEEDGRIRSLSVDRDAPTGVDIVVPGQFWGGSRTDLCYYRRRDGAIWVDRTRSGGRFRTVGRPRLETNRFWDAILPGDFGEGWRTDLLFYDRESGTGEFFATKQDSGGFFDPSPSVLYLKPLQTHTGWQRNWDSIVPGDFGGDGHTDLLFYSREQGLGAFYTTDGDGGIRHLRTHRGWRKTWDQIVPGNFRDDSHTDLLFYDSGVRS
ncbi:hypothetical protein [Haloarchaeobius sp. DT45]|uniref:hypothetical protein n=1 Tax=Haloarchaeobius sp. DT45 TaxID=3446116 RepID=UPI003F6C8A2E